MLDYAHTLGDAVKRARGNLVSHKVKVADAADVDVRTVLNIETIKRNPKKWKSFYPLIRALKNRCQRNLQSRNAERYPCTSST